MTDAATAAPSPREAELLNAFCLTPIEWARILYAPTVSDRLRAAIVTLVSKHGSVVASTFVTLNPDDTFSLDVSQRLMAQLISTTREGVCRTFTAWLGSGIVQVEKDGAKNRYKLAPKFFEDAAK